MSSDNRKVIIEVLKQHPEGLTISSIAKISGLHRHTSRKYINDLISSKEITQRTVGVAKLCYLNCSGDVKTEEKKSFFQRFNFKLVLAVVLVTFLLSEATIIAYENNSLNETYSDNASNTSPITSTIVMNDSNVTQIIENAMENSSNSSVDINDSLVPSENLTDNTSISNDTMGTSPQLSVDLDYPQKITRGEEFDVKAYVTNDGSSTVSGITADWSLPEGFEISSESNNCENLQPGGSCVCDVSVIANLSTSLGGNDVKVVINYEE